MKDMQPFDWTKAHSQTRQLIYQQTGMKHSHIVFWRIQTQTGRCSQQLTLSNKQKVGHFHAVKTSLCSHIHSLLTKIYLWFPFSILLLTPLEGGVFYMPCLSWLKQVCTNIALTVGVKCWNHNSLMCDSYPPHRAHGHLFILLGKCFHVLMPDSRHTDVTVNVSINGKIDVDVNNIC